MLSVRWHRSELSEFKIRQRCSGVSPLERIKVDRLAHPGAPIFLTTQAGYHLDYLVEQAVDLAEQKRLTPSSAQSSRASFDEVCRFCLASLDSWSLAYDATFTERRLTVTPCDVAMYQALRQRYEMARNIADRCIDVQAYRSGSEMPEDQEHSCNVSLFRQHQHGTTEL